MEKAEAKRWAELFTAYAEGKTIEQRELFEDHYEWVPVTNIDTNDFVYEYRIAPIPKYRPFNDYHECWDEMLKHEPVGWLMEHLNGDKAYVRMRPIYFKEGWRTFDDLFEKYTFADGEPFGIKEE